MPIDISDSVGTHIHLTKISQTIEEQNSDYDDIDIWFSYQKNLVTGKWQNEYATLNHDEDEIGWSVCDPVLDFHNNQLWF